MDDFLITGPKASAGLKIAFNAKASGWYIYSAGSETFAAFGKGPKPDTKILKQFVTHAAVAKNKVYRGAIRKVKVEGDPVCVLQPSGMPPPVAKIFADLKAVAGRAAVLGLFPKAAAGLLFNAKVHNAPETPEEEEEEVGSDSGPDVDPGRSDTASDAQVKPPKPPVSDPKKEEEDKKKREELVKALKGLLEQATQAYDRVMDPVAKLETVPSEASAQIELLSELYNQIEAGTQPAKVAKLKPAALDKYMGQMGEMLAELRQVGNVIPASGWFRASVPPAKVDPADQKANKALMETLKKQFKQVESLYTGAIGPLLDDPGSATAAELLYNQFVAAERLMQPASREFRFNEKERKQYLGWANKAIKDLQATIRSSNPAAPDIEPITESSSAPDPTSATT